EGVLGGGGSTGGGQRGALVLVGEEVVDESFESGIVVEDAIDTMLPGRRHLAIGGLGEHKGAAGGGLADSEVPFAAHRSVEGDAAAAEERAIVLAVDALFDADTPARGEAGQPSQPGQPATLHGGMHVTNKENVNIPGRGMVGLRGGRGE